MSKNLEVYKADTYQIKRIRSQKHCRLCNNYRFGSELYYKYTVLNVPISSLADFYHRKLDYMGNQGKFACARMLVSHFKEEHVPAWIMEAKDLALRKENEAISLRIGENSIKLQTDLINGKISDEEYLNKVKLLAHTNMLRFPKKVSVKHGLDAINLLQKKEALGMQKSESLRNWMKLISGKPDKQIS